MKRLFLCALVIIALVVVLPAFAAQGKGGEAKKDTAKTEKKAEPSTPPQKGMVWVNTASPDKVYHKEGTRWYGKTKEGKWMTEDDARKAGYREAGATAADKGKAKGKDDKK